MRLGPEKRERERDAGPQIGFDISNSGSPHIFPRILLGAKPEIGPTGVSCDCYWGSKESH